MIDQVEFTNLLRMLHYDDAPFDVDKTRDQLANYLEKYPDQTPKDRKNIRDTFGPEHGAKLLRCAQELAVRAVRNKSPHDIFLGALAVALEDIRSDFRNTVVSLCLLHHSAIKLGIDPAIEFYNAADYGSERTRQFIHQYLQSGEKDIRAMAMEETYGQDGFDYKVTI